MYNFFPTISPSPIWTSPPFIGGATGIFFVAVDNKYDADGIVIDPGILKTGSGNRMFIAGILGIVVALTATNPNPAAMTPIVVCFDDIWLRRNNGKRETYH